MANFPSRRRTSAVVSGAVSRRKTAWAASVDVTAAVNLAANSILLDATANAALLALRPFTVVRVRGVLWVQSDSVASSRTPFGALGFAVVTDTAAALGVTAVPAPIAAEGSGVWFVYQYFMGHRTLLTAAGFNGTEDWGKYEFDSKAMRKVDIGQDIAVVLQNRAAVGGMNYILKYRFLVKLH